MPINDFSSTSGKTENELDTTLLNLKLCLRTNYIESNTEEDNDMKNQYTFKTVRDPTSLREAASKKYVDNLFNNPSIMLTYNPQHMLTSMLKISITLDLLEYIHYQLSINISP